MLQIHLELLYLQIAKFLMENGNDVSRCSGQKALGQEWERLTFS